MRDGRVVLITAPNARIAQELARVLVEERLAACVNVLAGITSHYRWEGTLRKDAELLLIAKSRARSIAKLIAAVKKRHPAKVPEIIALPIREGDRAYLNWLAGSVS